ncbi:cell wall-associated hydrolase, invasion-associated protein [Mycobacteroides abscessus subsp. abscessus]|uniref:hypothetical protein n=1 Tax=Mycobacteroides abscessus TaxID=36809 RepID=UPI0009A5E61E|nr:hypothetical protein [Mycobacteroides abscessus]SKO34208.1 cell wall-associated hydrolase, invasion-associated protein [Mycobacteroides abscessus subsp. abscessus]
MNTGGETQPILASNPDDDVVPATQRRRPWFALVASVVVALVLGAAAVTVIQHQGREAAVVSQPPTYVPASAPQAAANRPVYSDDQITNGKRIIAAGIRAHAPTQGIVAALAASMSKSQLKNLASMSNPKSMTLPHDGANGDGDTLGVFGQGPSTDEFSGQGPFADGVAARMNPTTAAARFYREMKRLDDWRLMTPAQLAIAVAGVERGGLNIEGAKAFLNQYYNDAWAAVREERESDGAHLTPSIRYPSTGPSKSCFDNGREVDCADTPIMDNPGHAEADAPGRPRGR